LILQVTVFSPEPPLPPPSATFALPQKFDALKRKGGRYGNQLAMPFVIAVNSFDCMLTNRDFEEALLGECGFWGTVGAPMFQRVSAVLFTKNLWPPTLLTGQVYSCLYLNPRAKQPYAGVLTKLYGQVRRRRVATPSGCVNSGIIKAATTE
jgi:hypothetical protein